MKPENHPEKNLHHHAHSWMIFFATLCGLCGFAVNPGIFDASALPALGLAGVGEAWQFPRP
ncbi:MAG: hypothetical protein MUF86_01670 [Akkermansiaceae bacterium]|jgi:hypothetical protein|nr:hypothetical protein [Akkermansiaceae bacterium]